MMSAVHSQIRTRPALHASMLVALGCAALVGTASSADPIFTRDVQYPPVSIGGEILEAPWTGGLLSPKAQIFDVDGDADPDLLIVHPGGGMTFYRNVGDASAFDFAFVADSYQDLDVGTWATLADIDADGDLDLFTDGVGSVVFHRNDGDAQNPQWVTIDTAWQGIVNTGIGNTPAFFDADGDGDLDYVEMEQNFGTARLYRNDGTPQVPAMVFETNTWGCVDTFDPGAVPGDGGAGFGKESLAVASNLHGIAGISAADIDSDGDTDIFIGDLFNENLWFFTDPGVDPVCLERITHDYLPFTTSGLNFPFLADLDGDDDLDMVVSVANQSAEIDNLIYLRNEGSPQVPDHVVVTMNLIPAVDVGRGARPAFADLDGDGDRELLLGAQDGLLHLFLNTGTPTQPSYEAAGTLQDAAKAAIDVGFWASPELLDYDGDGDPDLFVGDGSGRIRFYRNTGTPMAAAFVLEETQFSGVKGDFNAVPSFGDLDADGDYDIIVGEFGTTLNPRLFYMRNDGTNASPIWVQVSNNRPETSVYAERVFTGDLAPELFDCDDDGDLDLFLGESDGNVNYYRNEGTPQVFDFVLVDEAFAGALVGRNSGPAFVDLDGDADDDLVIGEENGGANVFVNGTSVPVLLDRFEAVADGDAVRLTWSTRAEIGHLGFNVQRARLEPDVRDDAPIPPGVSFVQLNATLIGGHSPYAYVDRTVEEGRTYAYRLEDVGLDGTRTVHPPVRISTERFAGALTLERARALGDGTYAFEILLPRAAAVDAEVYDVNGRLVTRLIDEDLAAGRHQVRWDGRQTGGDRVTSGVYWLRVGALGRVLTEAMVVVR